MNFEWYKKLKKSKIVPKKITSFHFFCLSLSSFIFLILLFFSITFIIIRDNAFKNEGTLRYNIILNTRFGHHDEGFTQQAVEGVCLSFDIKPKNCNGHHAKFKEGTISYGYPYTMSDPKQINDYITNFVETSDVDVFVMPGFTYTDFLGDFINEYRDKGISFITLGTIYEFHKSRQEKKLKWPSYLWEVRFKEYLAGYYAAFYAGVYALKNPDFFNDYDSQKPGKQIAFGILGGLFILPIKYYALGFRLGIKVINENKTKFTDDSNMELATVDYKTIGGFDFKNGLKAKQLSLDMYKKGISVIFSVAVTLTKNMHSAALEMNKIKNKKSHWVIGVDIDQGVSLYGDSSQKVDDNIDHSLLVSATIKIKEVISYIIKNKIRKEKVSTKPVILEDSNFVGIPERFTKTEIWKEIKRKIPTQMSVSSVFQSKINDLVFQKSEAKLEREIGDGTNNIFGNV